jgi:GDP-4-dehydro-6-deoxy-D-mannose reductase
MSSFITGITGFVGQHLTRHLVERGEQVSGIDLGVPSSEAAYTASVCDLLDFVRLKRLVQECRPAFVYHLAGRVHPRESLSRPRDYYLTNVQGTVNLLEAMRQSQITARVLVVSSSKVYGRVPAEVQQIDESQPPKPETPYAVSKYLAEEVALQYFHNYETRVIIARPFNHSGPGQPTGFVIPDFCKQVAEIEALSPERQADTELRVGDLSPVRDFLDVRDVVAAYETLLKKGRPGDSYNVASGSGVSVKRMLDLLFGESSLPAFPEVSSGTVEAAPSDRHVGDNGKLQEATGWTAQYTLKQTLRDTLEYWRGKIAS